MFAKQWESLLPDESLGLAYDSVSAIASYVSRSAVGTSAPLLSQQALLCAYLSFVQPNAGWKEHCLVLLNEALSHASKTITVGLHGGIAGVGWAAQHIGNVFAAYGETGDMDDDPLEDLDSAFIRILSARCPQLPYDLISGLVGIGIYFLERLPRESARLGLSLIVEHLEQRSQSPSPGRVTWHTPSEHLPPQQRAICPNGFYNLGLAHGLPGIIFLLGETSLIDITAARSHVLLSSSIRWVLDTRTTDSVSDYSSWIADGQPAGGSRLAWCYGDLGLGYSVSRAADQLNGCVSIETLDHTLRRCTEWPMNSTRVTDTGLCHGAFGVAHIFNRLYQSRQKGLYRDAAVAWYQQGLSMRRTDVGIGGYPAWKPETALSQFVDDESFLSGSIGVALALLAATSSTAPLWDICLGLSGLRDRVKDV